MGKTERDRLRALLDGENGVIRVCGLVASKEKLRSLLDDADRAEEYAKRSAELEAINDSHWNDAKANEQMLRRAEYRIAALEAVLREMVPKHDWFNGQVSVCRYCSAKIEGVATQHTETCPVRRAEELIRESPTPRPSPDRES